MSTQVMSKKDFIAMLEREIKDDTHVILTPNIEGNSEVMKKRKLKRFPFAFASDAFAEQNSISDLFGLQGMNVVRKAPMFAVILATDEMVADNFKHPKDDK